MIKPNLHPNCRILLNNNTKILQETFEEDRAQNQTNKTDISNTNDSTENTAKKEMPKIFTELLEKYQTEGCSAEEIITVLNSLNINFSNNNGIIKFSYNGKNYSLQGIKDKAELQTGNSSKNISTQDLEHLYTEYLMTGAGGKDGFMLTKGASLIIEDNSTPQEKAQEIIEKFLKDNNITNITSDKIMELFGEIDKRLESAHDWVKRKGVYDDTIFSSMHEVINSMCLIEAGKAALTDENWSELVNIYGLYRNDEITRFTKLNEYLKDIGSELLPGDIETELKLKFVMELDDTSDAKNTFLASDKNLTYKDKTERIENEIQIIQNNLDKVIKQNIFDSFA